MTDLHIQFSGGRLDVDLHIAGSGITAVVGRSGAGKTTLLRAIAGLAPREPGKVVIGNVIWQDDLLGVFVPVQRRSVGFVFQEPSLLPHLTVRANITYGLQRRLPGDHPVKLDEVVALLGLHALMERAPATLSGGEQQRVAIARALATGPNLLLMDEPLAALDSQFKAELMPYFARIRQQLSMPIVYVSHSIDEVLLLADHAVILDRCRMTASGTIHDMAQRSDLPVGSADQVGTLVDAIVIAQDSPYQLTKVKFAGGTLWLSACHATIGATVRVHLPARDISLALSRPDDSSVLNCLSVVIRKLRDDGAGQMLVELDAGGCRLLSRITRKSAERLRLDVGMTVHALIKAVAILK